MPATITAASTATDPLSLAIFAMNASVHYLPWLWLIGTPITFALTATGVIGTKRLRRDSRPITDGPIAELLARLAASLRLGKRVGVAVCDRIAAPVLIGILRPIILLPPAALTGWSPDEIEMVLLHELAHVRRWDNLVNLAQRIVESLLFFHPAVWLISSWARREREACCDALVVTRTDRPHAYAELLVALAAQMPRSVLFHPAASSAMAAGPLRSRIRRILKLDDDPMLVSGKSFTLVLAALLTAAAVGLLYLPTNGHAEPSAGTTTESKDHDDSISPTGLEKDEHARFEHFEKSLKSIEIVVAIFNNSRFDESKLGSVYKDVSQRHHSLYLWGLHVDTKSEDAKKYRLSNAPTCIVFCNGKETAQLQQIHNGDELAKFVSGAVNKCVEQRTALNAHDHSNNLDFVASLFKAGDDNRVESHTYILPTKLEILFPQLPELIEKLKQDSSHPKFSYNLTNSDTVLEVYAPSDSKILFCAFHSSMDRA